MSTLTPFLYYFTTVAYYVIIIIYSSIPVYSNSIGRSPVSFETVVYSYFYIYIQQIAN